MKNFLNYLLLSCCILTTLTLQAQDKTPYLVKPFTASAVKDVEVKTSGGSINVLHKTDEASRVEVYIRGNQNNETLSKAEIEQR